MDLFDQKGAVDVAEPQLFLDIFPYEDFPVNQFIEGTYPYDVPEEIWITDTTFRDGQQSMESFTPKQIEDIFRYMHDMDKMCIRDRPEGAFNAYTTNLEVIRQKLLSDDEVCVSIPQFIAAKKLASAHIVQLTMLDQKLASMGFFYNRQALEMCIRDSDITVPRHGYLSRIGDPLRMHITMLCDDQADMTAR